jgi:hypothetical protein
VDEHRVESVGLEARERTLETVGAADLAADVGLRDEEQLVASWAARSPMTASDVP